ncbi:MAG: tetratricopeptide repeat protein [Gammaproteobacteria bacterium]|nr:tetratricopeptide repeat protein [Gammaproteobacteria bacterium]
MSLLMDALRKAEEEKRKAQAASAGGAAAAGPEPVRAGTFEPTLEPLVTTARERAAQGELPEPGERSDEQLREPLALGSGRVPEFVPGGREPFGPGRDAVSAGRDTRPGIAGNDPTAPTMERAVVVGAHTVFAARSGGRGNATYRIALGSVLALFVIVAGAAYCYYSLQLTPVTTPVSLAAVAAAPVPPSTPPTSAPGAVTPVVPSSSSAAATPPASGDNAIRLAPEPAVPAAVPQAVPAAPTPEVETTPRLLRVSRRTVPVTLDGNLVEGYDALQRGDLTAARAAYLAALRNDASSRDALLGLAAVAVRQGDAPQARSWYREQLRLNPSDAIASAGLAALSGDDAEAGESELRQLLARQPGSAPLHFTLGRLLARQQRWPEAQQQFFAAFGAAADQADYAFNLAVSLDHLGQSAAAMDYYRKALALAAAGSPATFDAAATRARIDALAVPATP